MVEYEYTGVDKAGKRVNGKLDAPNEGDVRMILRSQGVRPNRISRPSMMNTDLGSLFAGKGGARVKLESMIAFTRQLQVLISSGIPVVQGLEILGEQSTDKSMKNIILNVKERVSGGSYLWESLAAYPNAFPKIYTSLIRAGEASGSLDSILKRLCRYLEDADRLRKIMKSAMMYPIVVTCIGALVMGLMLTIVIPKFEQLLGNSGQELPAATQFVINLSHFLVRNIVTILISLTISIFLLVKFVRTEEGKAIIDRTAFRAPLFGNLVQKGSTARFARTMQTLLASGVNLIDAIDICRATIGNVVLEDAVGKIRSEVESGKTLGSVITRLKVFPSMAVQMISVGESTGNLDKMLEKVADFYEEEVETAVQGLTKLIEPLVLVVLGGMVGGLMIAMYLPIFKAAGAAG